MKKRFSNMWFKKNIFFEKN